MNDMDFVDISEGESVKKKDKFMICIYISLIVLVVLSSAIYFFGYDVLKPYIKV